MPVRRQRNQDEELTEGEPSRRRRTRPDPRVESDLAPEPDPPTVAGDSVGEQPEREADAGEQPEREADAGEQPESEAGETAHTGAGVADLASRRVAAIVQAAEESALEIKARAQRDADELRERLAEEARAEAEVIKQKALDALRVDLERLCVRIGQDLRATAREAIDREAAS